MFYVLQNESTAALRRVPILLTDAATGTTAQTGVAITNIYPQVNINGGAFAGGAGTVAEAGYGQYYYQFDATEVATLGLAGIHVTAVGCRDYDAIAQVAAFNVYSASGVGITAADVWNYDISGVVGAGLAGSQLNVAAAGGGSTTGDIATAVWDYAGATVPATVKETLETASTQASNAASNTGSSAIRDAVWDTDVSYLTTPQAGAALYQAALGTTQNAPSEVWSYVTREITGGLANTVTTVTNPVEVSTPAMAGIANTVWSTLTAPYTTHATFGHNVLRSDNAATIGEVTLHQSGGSKRVDADVHAFVNNTASATAMLNILTGIGASMTTNITGNITGSLSGSVGSVTNPVSVATASMSGIANTVWSTDISSYTSPSAGYDLSNASSGAGLTAGDVTNAVWDVATSSYTTSGTFGHNILRSDVAGTAGTVSLWTGGAFSGVFADTYRIDEDYNAAIALKDILTGIGASITGNITGDLSGSVGYIVDDVTLSASTQASIANSVWSTDISGYTSPSAGFDLSNASSGAGITAGDVWNYTLLSSGQSADTTLGNADDQATGANTNTNSPTLEANIWSYATRTLTSSSAPTAADIWSYAGGRTITGGIVTSVGDKTGYSLSSTQSFNLTGNITGSVSGSVGSVTGSVGSVVNPVLVATASMSGIANTVWTNASRTITGGAVTSVVDPVNISTTSMSGIAGTVWTYSPRTLTSGAGSTAGDIWNYNISGITASGTAGAVLNDASVSGSVVTIVNGPYRLTSIAEGTDGRIDILAESVQTIQLNCLDGFGQPFNVTGYAVVINVYDVSGALAVTYTPTVDFASSGIVSFDIDTDVTGVTGRYTLVVELTAGAEVVQLGPLEILVRPL
jgi:hypothetical protein